MLFNIMTKSRLLAKSKFFGRISTMGDKKVVIYVPQGMHEEILKNFKGKTIKVTLEDAED
jgi:hypothetical protein